MKQILKATYLCLVLGMTTGLASAENEPVSQPVKNAKLNQLKFLTGVWRSTANGETAEEIWGSVQGDSMVGHCQSVQENKTTLYEILAILQENEKVVMRIKHFKAGFVPWAEKAESGDLNLVSIDKTSATFQNDGSESVRISYKRTGNQLTATVSVVKNGQKNTFPFTYTLINKLGD